MGRSPDAISDQLRAGRVALPHPPRTFSAPRAKHFHLPQQDGPDCVTDPRLGLVHAAEWRRWGRRALEWGNLTLPADGFRAANAFDGALRRGVPARGHDDPGLRYHL